MRKRYWLLIVFVSVAALMMSLSNDLSEQQMDNVAKQDQVNERDYFVVGLRTTTFNEAGKIQNQVEASTAEHYPREDITYLTEPTLRKTQKSGEFLQIVSDEGVIKSDKILHMQNNVVIAPVVESPPYIVTTDYLEIDSENEIAQTDKLVLFQSTHSQLTAEGMKLYLNTEVMELNSKVKGYHEPINE